MCRLNQAGLTEALLCCSRSTQHLVAHACNNQTTSRNHEALSLVRATTYHNKKHRADPEFSV
jgi:hypothetical protein